MPVLPIEPVISAEQVRSEKAGLLHSVGLSEEELQKKAADGTYSLEEFYVWESIQGLNFLISEDGA